MAVLRRSPVCIDIDYRHSLRLVRNLRTVISFWVQSPVLQQKRKLLNIGFQIEIELILLYLNSNTNLPGIQRMNASPV